MKQKKKKFGPKINVCQHGDCPSLLACVFELRMHRLSSCLDQTVFSFNICVPLRSVGTVM